MDLLIENPLENNGFYTKNSKHNGRLGIPGYWKIIAIEGDDLCLIDLAFDVLDIKCITLQGYFRFVKKYPDVNGYYPSGLAEVVLKSADFRFTNFCEQISSR